MCVNKQAGKTAASLSISAGPTLTLAAFVLCCVEYLGKKDTCSSDLVEILLSLDIHLAHQDLLSTLEELIIIVLFAFDTASTSLEQTPLIRYCDKNTENPTKSFAEDLGNGWRFRVGLQSLAGVLKFSGCCLQRLRDQTVTQNGHSVRSRCRY